MKNRSYFAALLGVSMMYLTACSWLEPSFEEVNPEGFYFLKIPSYLSSTQRLSQGAALQLQNLDEDIFVILRTTSLDSLRLQFPESQLEDFYELHLDNLYQKLENPVLQGPDTLDNPYYRAIRGSIRGEYKGNLLAHQLVVYEDSLFMYQLLQWMPASKWKDRERDMELMIQSLRPSI